MNLQKLFEAQRVLDEHIMNEHPVQENENRLEKKILALQVELGECANEWRGFKFWSNNQKPRTMVLTDNPDKTDKNKPWLIRNLLLEEYVDCLHFILSIGVQKSWTFDRVPLLNSDEALEIQFNEVFLAISHFYVDKRLSNYERVLIVFLSLGQSLDFTWEEIEQAYFDKNQINHQRQEEGY
ncbi:dUTP diphosphatase [Lysinibacillus halotolerans]